MRTPLLAVRDALPVLLQDFQVVHICGKDKVDEKLNGTAGYKQFDYVKSELKIYLLRQTLSFPVQAQTPSVSCLL